jgi:hypothetical protein
LQPGSGLKEEKELTRRSDELARRRQELPWVRVDREDRFETDEGSASWGQDPPVPSAVKLRKADATEAGRADSLEE